MKLRYQYRLYPTQRQQTELSKVFGCARVVWNDALRIACDTPKREKWPKYSELQRRVIAQAKKTPARCWLNEISAVVLQQSVMDLNTAFKNFLESRSGKRKGRKVGFPRFKKRSNRQAVRFVKTGFSLKKNKLFLAKLGLFKVRWSRDLPSAPSSVTIIKNTAGQYYASFVVEVHSKSVAPSSPSTGVDLGLKTFAFLGNKERVESPGYTQLPSKVKRLQRRLLRQQRGSNRRERTRLRIAKLKLRIANIRKDFLHKLSAKLVTENQVVCLEDLNVAGMLKNRKLSRAISEQGWSTFRAMCEAKAAQHDDRQVCVISRWEPTSQTCSTCGCRWGKLDLSVRLVLCVSCGTQHDRDHNAAINIEQSGSEHSRDSKRAMNRHKTALCGNRTASLSHPCDTQLSLCI